MGNERFLTGQREAGNKDITPEECQKLKNTWFAAYPELKKYFELSECPITIPGEKLYSAEALNGFKRVNCSFCAALNLPFQSLASSGSKLAAWDLYMAGYRIALQVHGQTSPSMLY